MHELSIAQSLVEIACAEGRRAGAAKITRLNCRIGALRQIDDLTLHDAFEIAREGTRCAGAKLAIEHIPLMSFCRRCGSEFAVERWRWNCPACDSEGEPLPGGDELELTSIEADTDP